MYHENWKEMCDNDPALIAYVTATVVRDEFNPRHPTADDIALAKRLILTKDQAPHFMGATCIFPAAPDGLKL